MILVREVWAESSVNADRILLPEHHGSVIHTTYDRGVVTWRRSAIIADSLG